MLTFIREWWRSRHSTFEPIGILPLTDEQLDSMVDYVYLDQDVQDVMSDYAKSHEKETKVRLRSHFRELYQTNPRGESNDDGR